MRYLFIGFLFVFLDFNINLGNSTIGLLPAFVGYLSIGKGLTELAGESERFVKIRPFTVAMGVYSGILYFLNLLGFSQSLGAFGVVLGVVSTLLSLYIAYQIVSGVQEMETNRQADLNGKKLGSVWGAMALFQILTYASLLLPALSMVFILASAAASIAFLVCIHTSKNLYERLPDTPSNNYDEIDPQ